VCLLGACWSCFAVAEMWPPSKVLRAVVLGDKSNAMECFRGRNLIFLVRGQMCAHVAGSIHGFCQESFAKSGSGLFDGTVCALVIAADRCNVERLSSSNRARVLFCHWRKRLCCKLRPPCKNEQFSFWEKHRQTTRFRKSFCIP